ncbi:RICIN domain-containing protein [uncultured Holdemanella sp.]|uniref:RICIN domain-containing protein n=1 Tax=uncultured Holdemanella sp. TaxID=1763549 RepID=UPI0025FC9E02|nr:RICIN domain-containing protein [uncultured Holdemanella sp.]
MHKRLKPVLAFVLSLFMSVSTLSNTYTVFAEDEITQEETVEETNTEDTNTTEETTSEEENVEEESDEVVEENTNTNTNVEEQMGDSNMMEYFLVDSPVVSSQETENFVLSLNNIEGYSNFKITIQKEDGTTFDLESSEQVGNLVKFSNVFRNKGEYKVTSLHYEYNGQMYYLNFSDLEMDVQFGVDQEYVGYDETLPDLTEDTIRSEGVIQVTDVNKAEEEIANGMASEASIMSMDEFSRAATGDMTICLDPGHGGSDSGANAFGQKESALTLKIANYCKEELAKYDVNVVMTRTTDTRPSENAAQDLINRVMTAKKAGASYIISIHLNSAASTSAHGAEVYFPNTSGNASLSSNGQAMAKAIQSQLVALGLYNRGIKIRNYMDGSTSSNPNSSDRDYYGIIRYAKEQNISGLIIEHCFLNNPDEYNKYLSSEEKLQKLGVADAKGIVSALGLSLKNAYLDQIANENKNLIPDGKYVISSMLNSKYVLDVKNGSMNNSANIELSTFNNETDNQAFIVSHDAQGYITFTNAKSGKVLDVSDGKAGNSKNVQQYESNGTRAQKWVVKKSNKGYMIISALDSNYVLDVSGDKASNGANVQLYIGNGSDAQNWNIEKFVSKYEQLDALANSNKNTISDGKYVIRTALNSSFGLDVKGGSTSNYGNIQLYLNNDSTAQAFKVSHDAQGYVTFTNVNSGKALDVSGGIASNGRNVQQYTSNGTRSQKWIIKKSGNGYTIVSALDSNFVLDLSSGKVNNGQNIQIYSSNNSNAQKWNFTKYMTKQEKLNQLATENKNAISDGVYKVVNAQNSNYVLDIASGSKNNGANVQLYLSNGTTAQSYKVSHDAQGYVTFINVNSGRALDVSGGKAANYSNVQQYNSNGTKSQKWIVKKSNAGYTIISALDSNYVLDLSGGKVVNSRNIQIYQGNGSTAQQWTFEKNITERERLDEMATQNKSMMDDGVYYIKNRDVKFALDVASASLNSGANVQLYSLNKTDAQKWLVSHDSKGYVSFKNVNSGMYLAATGSSNGANVNQQSQSNGYNQKWIVAFDSNQNIKLVSGLDSKLVIDVSGGKIQNGSNIQLYTSNNSAAQKWVFEYISKDVQVSLTKIMGTSQTSVAQMVRYYKANASGYDTFKAKYEGKYDGSLAKGGASTIEQFAQIFYEEANAEGVKAEVAFTQCMKETGFLKYGGDVLPNQYNFAGIGATGAVHGASFKDVRTGIRAQIQHLKAYASTSPLNNACVDPRFNLVTRNTAPYVEWLGIQENPNGYGWASAKNYGYDIVGMVKVLLSK